MSYLRRTRYEAWMWLVVVALGRALGHADTAQVARIYTALQVLDESKVATGSSGRPARLA